MPITVKRNPFVARTAVGMQVIDTISNISIIEPKPTGDPLLTIEFTLSEDYTGTNGTNSVYKASGDEDMLALLQSFHGKPKALIAEITNNADATNTDGAEVFTRALYLYNGSSLFSCGNAIGMGDGNGGIKYPSSYSQYCSTLIMLNANTGAYRIQQRCNASYVTVFKAGKYTFNLYDYAAFNTVDDGFPYSVHQQVTLTSESFFLPLNGITEIPELLTVTAYDPYWDSDQSKRYDQMLSSSPISGHVSRYIAYTPNSWEPNSNSGNIISPQNFFESILSYGAIYSTGTIMVPYGRYGTGNDSKNVGYPSISVERASVQQSFPLTCKAAGYRLDSNGNLYLTVEQSVQNSGNRKWQSGVIYNITAAYRITNPNHPNYFKFDRTVNTTNITQGIT